MVKRKTTIPVAPAEPPEIFLGWETWDGKYIEMTEEPDWLKFDREWRADNRRRFASEWSFNDYAAAEQKRLDEKSRLMREHKIARLIYRRS